jgi:hypothetical protein
MMNAMKRRFRKCCTRSHAGKPALTVRADGGTPGYRIRKSFTVGTSRNPCATATPMTPSTKPSGKAHSTFIQRRPILILGTTPTWGGNQLFRRIRSSAPVSAPSSGSGVIAFTGLSLIGCLLPLVAGAVSRSLVSAEPL